MSSVALRPRSSTELVDASIQVYKRDPVTFILGMALFYVPWLVVRLALGMSADDPFAITPVQSAITTVAFAIVYVFTGGVTTIVGSDVYLGKPSDLKRALAQIGANYFRLLAALLAVGILAFLAGFLLFFPALYVVTRFFAVKQAILLEGASIGESLSRSSALTVGFKWHAFKTLALTLMIVIAVDIGVYWLVGVIPNRVVGEVAHAMVTSIVMPIFGISQTLLYYDLRIRKEGFDVEYLAAQAPAGVATSATAAER